MLLKKFLDICLLRANPQDLPASDGVMLRALAAYALADVLGVLDIVSAGTAALAALIDTLLLVAVTLLALRWRRLDHRLPQTLAALAGGGALLSLLAWATAAFTRTWFSGDWVWVVFMIWYTLVFGHVLRHALSIPLAAGVSAGLLYLLLSISVTGLFINSAPVVN